MRHHFLLTLLLLPILASAQSNLQLLGQLPYAPVGLAGCWHYVDSTGGEYALVGTTIGLSIVDLQDPAHPVERFAVPGLSSNWREIKTWAGFAYVGTEADSSGIIIVDLRALPDTIYWKTWRGDGLYEGKVRRSHTVQAENGYLYVFGGGDVTNGATIADLSDPWNPHIIGKYTVNYVHDGFIRGDTLWTSEIYSGQFGVVDISDKTDPQLLLTNSTPGLFNHNTGLSDDSRTLFTTDEKFGAPLGSFDISDLENINLLDRYFPSQKPTQMVHNVRVLGDFLVNPSYGGQLTIVDATYPDNLIETAWYVVGTSLVWDADPYLPSGIIFASAKNEGFFVFQPTYQHAAWLNGLVTDSLTGQPLINAKVFVLETPNADTTGSNGVYKTGAAASNNYQVQVVRTGYVTKTMANVALTSGQTTELNIALVPEVVSTIDLPDAASVHVWPTIFNEGFTIKTAVNSSYKTAQVLDLQGNVILETSLNAPLTHVAISPNLPAAMYRLRLFGQGQAVYNVPLIKQ